MVARMLTHVQEIPFDLARRCRDRARDDWSSRAPADVCIPVQDRQFPCVAVKDWGVDGFDSDFDGLGFGESEEDQRLGCGDGFLTAYKPRKPFVARRVRMWSRGRRDAPQHEVGVDLQATAVHAPAREGLTKPREEWPSM